MRKLCVFFAVILFVIFGCTANQLFQQPSITVIDYELKEPPGEYTYLLMECDIKNNDTHDGDVKKIDYRVTVEGVQSQQMTYSEQFTMGGSQTVRKKLPLTFLTADALPLLLKIGGGSPLNYAATGNILADTPLGEQNLDLNVSGSADLEIDLNDFFLQPTITMDETQGFQVTVLGSPAIPPFIPASPTTVIIKKTDVLNNDTREVLVKKVEYTVTIEGVQSQKMTHTPASAIAVAANGQAGDTISIADLPLTFSYSALVAAVNFAVSGTYYVDYTIKGKVLIEADLGEGPVEFYVPLDTSGTNTIFVSPS